MKSQTIVRPENKYKKLIIPTEKWWDRKEYNPYRLFEQWIYDKFLYTSLRYYLEKFLFNPVDNVYYGIRNVIKWLPAIWKDGVTCSSYFYDLIEHKIVLQRKLIVKRNFYMSTDKTNSDMTIILNLIDKVKSDFYSMESYDYCEFTPLSFTKSDHTFLNPLTGVEEETYTMDDKVIWEKWDDYLAMYPSTIRYIKKHEPDRDISDKRNLVFLVGYYNEIKAKRILFKMLEEKIHQGGFWI